ncbi:MAG: rhodanese-like domain-containing protein [Gemmiger sp.]
MEGFGIPYDINEGLLRFQATPGAVLLDVRTPQEYAAGHLPGSWNLPVEELDRAPEMVPDQRTPLFLYCRSGARSHRAAERLRRMEYQQVCSIGGVNAYRGELTR